MKKYLIISLVVLIIGGIGFYSYKKNQKPVVTYSEYKVQRGDIAINNGLASEQPIGDADKYTFAGISVMSPRLVDGLVSGQPAALAPLLKQAMIKFQITAEIISDNWIDVGTPERLAQVNEFIKSNGVDHHQGV